MIYREYLVMRKALAWFAGVLLGIVLVGLISKTIHITGSHTAGMAASAGWLSAIFAAIFGVALGNGSREASRVLWVLPAERWKLALQVVAVDLAGTTAAFACVYTLNLFALALAGFQITAEMLRPVSLGGIIMALAMAYAAYGWSALIGMLGRRMAYCGIIALPALMMWMLFAQSWVRLGPGLRTAIIANPFVVFNTGLTLTSRQHYLFALDAVTSSLQWLGTTWETPVLLAITIVTCGLAVVLWQRAEAIS